MVVNLEDTGQVSTCIVSYDKDISITYLVDRGVIGPRKAYQPRSGLAVYFGPGNVRICTYLNLPLFFSKTIEKKPSRTPSFILAFLDCFGLLYLSKLIKYPMYKSIFKFFMVINAVK